MKYLSDWILELEFGARSRMINAQFQIYMSEDM